MKLSKLRMRSMGITLCIVLASCFVVGGFGKIQGIDFIAGKIYANHLNVYQLSELYNEDGQEEKSFLQMILSGKVYFDEGWDMETEETVALALEENMNKMEQESTEEYIEPSEGSLGDTYGQEENVQPVASTQNSPEKLIQQLKQSNNSKFLLEKFYIIDSTTSATAQMFPVKKLLDRDNTIKKDKNKRQILIYHTHGASESYQKGASGNTDTSIVDVGSILANELQQKYGYGVYHDKTKYDLIHGSIDRSAGYNVALHGVQDILSKNKDIQVIIDLHRDGVGKKKADSTVKINGKETARVMFFNGLSRSKSGEISYLHNLNLEGNLSFSLQMKLKAMERFPGLTKPIYLKGYRYNLHLKSRSLLIELGNEYNTIDEANNAVILLAKVIDEVLSKK